MTFKWLHGFFGLIAVILFSFSMVGCVSYPSGSVVDDLSFTENAALKRAVAKDSFPTASQAGIPSSVSSDTK